MSKSVTFHFASVKGCSRTKKQTIPKNIADTIPLYNMSHSFSFREGNDLSNFIIKQETTITAIKYYLMWKAGKLGPNNSIESISEWIDTVKLTDFLQEYTFIDRNPPPPFTEDVMKEFITLASDAQGMIAGSYIERCMEIGMKKKRVTLSVCPSYIKDKLHDDDKILSKIPDSQYVEYDRYWTTDIEGKRVYIGPDNDGKRVFTGPHIYEIERTIHPTFRKRLVNLCTLLPLLAEWIWNNVDRKQLLVIMNVPNKRRGRLSLIEFNKVLPYINPPSPVKNIVDDKELQLIRELKWAQAPHIGSRYIDSEAIEIAQNNLNRYRSTKKKQLQQKKVAQRTVPKWNFRSANARVYKSLFIL